MSVIETYCREVIHTFVLAEPELVKDHCGDIITVERVVVSCQLERKPVVIYKGRLRKRDGSQRQYAAFKTVYPCRQERDDHKWIAEVIKRALSEES